MKDTTARIEKIYNDMLLKKTPAERINMSCSMFDLACSMIKSSFPKGLSDAEIKQRLFLRFYGNDFDEATKAKIIKQIKDRS